jgi:hypothetical protein
MTLSSDERRQALKRYCTKVLAWTQVHGNPLATALESVFLSVEMGYLVRLALEPFPSAADIKQRLARVRGYLAAVTESTIASEEEQAMISRASLALIDIE